MCTRWGYCASAIERKPTDNLDLHYFSVGTSGATATNDVAGNGSDTGAGVARVVLPLVLLLRATPKNHLIQAILSVAALKQAAETKKVSKRE